MHTCSYCGIEYEQTEIMCPACGHKSEKIISIPKKAEEVYKKEEKKELKKEEIKAPLKSPEDVEKATETDAFYKDALAKLEKSLLKEKTGEKEDKKETGKVKKEKEEVKKEESGKEKSKKEEVKKIEVKKPSSPSLLMNLIYTSRISYVLWFFIGFFILSFVSGYQYGAIGWFGKTFHILFSADISTRAELLNVHHLINDINPIGTFNILNGDVLFFIPVISGIIPLLLWFIKKKTRGIAIAGNSNIFAGLMLSLASTSILLFILRVTSFDYFFFNIILAITLWASIFDLGILVHLFKPKELQFGGTVVVFLYNIGIPIVLVAMNMAFDFILILI